MFPLKFKDGDKVRIMAHGLESKDSFVVVVVVGLSNEFNRVLGLGYIVKITGSWCNYPNDNYPFTTTIIYEYYLSTDPYYLCSVLKNILKVLECHRLSIDTNQSKYWGCLASYLHCLRSS